MRAKTQINHQFIILSDIKAWVNFIDQNQLPSCKQADSGGGTKIPELASEFTRTCK